MATSYSQEFCAQCGKVSPRETTRVTGEARAYVLTEYCKACKGFNRTETDASGAIIQQQTAI